MLKKIVNLLGTLMVNTLAISDFWELPYCGTSIFFFGEPEYPSSEI